MIAPKTVSELKVLIDGMEHRERFVFNVGHKTVELYNTILDNKNADRNICITVLNQGEIVQTKSKLHRLWKDDSFERLHYIINNL
jgi:hypothetical protein